MSSHRRLSVRSVLIVGLLAGIAAHAAHALSGFGGHAVDRFFEDWLLNGLIIATSAACLLRGLRVREERLAWLVLGAAMLSWSGGFVYWTLFIVRNPTPPYPSPADALWLAYYPAAYVAIVLIIRSRIRAFQKSLWLDGLIGGLAVASFGAALVFGAVLSSTGGNATQIAINLAYPLGDMLLVAFVVSMFALTGWRPGRAGLLLGAGFALNAVGDSLWVYSYATDTYRHGSLTETIWPVATGLIALAAWQPARRAPAVALSGPRILVVPVVSGIVALGVLVSMRFAPLNDVALTLASATLLAVLARLVFTLREHLRLVEFSRGEANTDALTGLGNRRKFMSDLQARLLLASPAQPMTLALFDLDGFKAYNDTFGHPAGDALLTRLGHRLQAPWPTPAWPTGSEATSSACWPPARRAQRRSRPRCRHSPSAARHSRSATRTAPWCSTTRIASPRTHCESPTSACTSARTADASQPATRARPCSSVPCRSDTPTSSPTTPTCRGWSSSSHAELNVPEDQLAAMHHAAELHDIGKVGIPDAILSKPGPLDAEEWAFIRRHTIIGERIVAGAPALAEVGRLVRSSHERWDGAGYPDELAGDDDPAGLPDHRRLRRL